jgi:phospholipase A-2-activating protein
LESNNLPLTYIDEVVKFIEKNTAGVNIGGGGDEYSDPFTGNEQDDGAFASANIYSRRFEVPQFCEFCPW